jgi:hypothetical protein
MEYVANRLELILDVINEPTSKTPAVDIDGDTAHDG